MTAVKCRGNDSYGLYEIPYCCVHMSNKNNYMSGAGGAVEVCIP